MLGSSPIFCTVLSILAMILVELLSGNKQGKCSLSLWSWPLESYLVQSHFRSAAAFLSLVRCCLGLLQVLCREEALPHPRGACRTAEGAAHVLVTLCGPAGNGIAVAPPEACSGRRLAVVRSALPPFWHCCHHWLVAMESCQLGWRPLVGLNLVSSLRALKDRS